MGIKAYNDRYRSSLLDTTKKWISQNFQRSSLEIFHEDPPAPLRIFIIKLFFLNVVDITQKYYLHTVHVITCLLLILINSKTDWHKYLFNKCITINLRIVSHTPILKETAIKFGNSLPLEVKCLPYNSVFKTVLLENLMQLYST